MPEISRFLGIIIAMYYKDHRPPHFHAKYGEYKASFSINEFNLLEGYLPSRVLSIVLEWGISASKRIIRKLEIIRTRGSIK